MINQLDKVITETMVAEYYELNRQKKEIESKMEQYKKAFNQHFDTSAGVNIKGELHVGSYKLQRQIRKTEKYNDVQTVQRLEELNLGDLVQIIKRVDEEKVKAAIQLGLLSRNDLEGCLKVQYTPAISVKA